MSKKKNSPQNPLGQGTIKKLSDLEEMILQDEAADFSVSQPAPNNNQTQQPLSDLDGLASLEGNLLQDSPVKEVQPSRDEGSLLDSIAELEDDFLYDDLIGAETSESISEAETAVSVADDTSIPDEDIAALADQPLDKPFDGAGEIVLALEDEMLTESIVEEAEASAEESAEVAVIKDEEVALDMGEAIRTAFADVEAIEPESETAVFEPPVVEPATPDEWDALADVEADLLTEAESVDEDSLADLSDFETDLLQEPATTAVVEETDEVVEEAPVEDAEGDIFEAFFAEAEAAEKEAAKIEVAEAEQIETEEEALAVEEETAVSETVGPQEADAETTAPEAEDLEFIAELEAEDHHFLDDLIASIDTELASAKAAEAMMDLAAPTAAETETLVQHVIFTLGSIKCAVPAANIREVGEINYITPVPNVPDWLLGITSLRGDILSLVDLAAFLDLSTNEAASFSVSDVEIMVVQSQQETLTAITTGLIVDEVDDIQDIAMEHVRMPTASLDNQLGAYMRGVYEENGQMIILLDLERLLMSPEMWQFEAI